MSVAAPSQIIQTIPVYEENLSGSSSKSGSISEESNWNVGTKKSDTSEIEPDEVQNFDDAAKKRTEGAVAKMVKKDDFENMVASAVRRGRLTTSEDGPHILSDRSTFSVLLAGGLIAGGAASFVTYRALAQNDNVMLGFSVAGIVVSVALIVGAAVGLIKK